MTADGCTTPASAGRQVESIVDQYVADSGLRAALVRLDMGNETIARVATGDSMVGQPANLRMNFRIGAIAIPFVIDVLLQLVDRGKISLDDPIANWFPDLPNADQVTLRMLASSTSGYPDWVQENPAFLDQLYSDVFRQWKTKELLEIALARPLVCDPGQCFHYAHTNFIILGNLLKEVTGRSVAALLHSRVLKPLGLRNTAISPLPAIPPPVLHAYTVDRGPYEDSTFWSPSWGIAANMLMTSTIGDVIKAAKALGRGALISPASARERIAPTTAGLPGLPRGVDFYYGLGLLVFNGWQLQNPEVNGYTAIQAWLPDGRLSLAITATRFEAAAATGTNYSQQILRVITEYLTPAHPVPFPSG